jgi:tRNA threonylcarbamoyladenosine biosynthesis protein TsaE
MVFMEIFISTSPQATEEFAAKLAKTLKGGEVIAFRGDLGAGKTCFTRGLAAGLDFKGEVNSPTFALINEYLGGRLNIYHFDMYRISSWEELYSSGYYEYLDMGGVVVCEWSENIDGALPDDAIIIEIEKIDETTRKITVFLKGGA